MNRADRKGLTAFHLKLIACACMLMDHVAVVLLEEDSPAYLALRLVGRLAFPLFAFLVAEGARRTANPWKYLLRLGVCALISEVPYDLALGTGPLDLSAQNVLWTLAFALLGIQIYRLANRRWPHSALQLLGIGGVLALSALAWLIRADYGAIGVLLPFGLYIWMTEWGGDRRRLIFLGLFLGIVWWNGSQQLFAVAAFPLMMFYNGRKGTEISKWWFYTAYPVHFLILYGLARLLLAGGNTAV